jgi:predicted nuclease of predicted toxin-antitoxin system
MKLLLDQGLPLSAASLLTQQGFSTIHVSEIEMWAAEDLEIVKKALAENRVVVTLDADFHSILALNNFSAPSVIRIRIERLRALALTQLIVDVIHQCQEDLEHGAAVTIELNRIRIRRLPLISNS